MGDASHVAAILLLFGAATADAQIAPPPNAAGAYQKLSPGNQKVARALFEAQKTPTTTTTTKGASKTTSPSPSASSAAGGANGPKPLTLDQIAAMKQSGTGWEQVFRQMRAQGLVTDKNIGQVMTRYNQSSRPPSASVVTTGGGRASLAGSGAPSNESARGNGDSYGRSGNLR